MGGFSSFGDRLYLSSESSEDTPAPAYRLLENYSTKVLSRGGCPLGALVQINLRQNFLSVENVETSAVIKGDGGCPSRQRTNV